MFLWVTNPIRYQIKILPPITSSFELINSLHKSAFFLNQVFVTLGFMLCYYHSILTHYKPMHFIGVFITYKICNNKHHCRIQRSICTTSICYEWQFGHFVRTFKVHKWKVKFSDIRFLCINAVILTQKLMSVEILI